MTVHRQPESDPANPTGPARPPHTAPAASQTAMPGPGVPLQPSRGPGTTVRSPLAEWLLQPSTIDAMEQWHELIAPLATVQSPKALWNALEKIAPGLVQSDDAALYLGVPSNMVPQIMFDRGGHYQQASPEELDEEFRNPIVRSLLEANPGIRTLDWRLFAATLDELTTTAPFNTWLARRGWDYPLGLVFWKGGKPIGAWAFYRRRSSGDFTPEEQSLIERLYEPVRDAVQRVLALTIERTRHQALVHLTRELPLPYAVVSLGGRLLASNRSGRELLTRWQQLGGISDAAGQSDLPADLRQAVTRQAARFHHQLKCDLWATDLELEEQLAHPQQPAWQARITMLSPRSTTPAEPVILIRLSDQSQPGADPAPNADSRDQLLSSLTLRERELVDAVLQGLSNKEIADLLHKSVPTVKHQLNRIYAKLGIPNRKRLLAIVR